MKVGKDKEYCSQVTLFSLFIISFLPVIDFISIIFHFSLLFLISQLLLLEFFCWFEGFAFNLQVNGAFLFGSYINGHDQQMSRKIDKEKDTFLYIIVLYPQVFSTPFICRFTRFLYPTQCFSLVILEHRSSSLVWMH